MRLSRICVLFLFVGLSAGVYAQVQIGDATHVGFSGNIGTSYSASFSDLTQSSSHGVDVNGDGTLSGYYFHPNFLQFESHPHYGRSEQTANSISIGRDAGVENSVRFFGGSHFPGSIGYSKDFSGTGQYAVPGSTALVTEGSGQAFNTSWGAMVPGWPTLNVGYTHANGSSSVVGIAGSSEDHNQSVSLSSGYRLGGWPVSVNYIHYADHWLNSGSVTGIDNNQQSRDSYWSVYTSHPLPFTRGDFNVSYTRGDQNSTALSTGSDSEKDRSSGGSNTVNSSASYKLSQRASGSAQFGYTDNALSDLTQQLAASGSAVLDTTSSRLRSLNYGASLSVALPHQLMVIGGASRQQQYYLGNEYDSTVAFGALNYAYLRPFLGSFRFDFGFTDDANKDGNQGLGYHAQMDYSHIFGAYTVTGSLRYTQNVQTVASFITTSGVDYGTGLNRKMAGGLYWHANFAGSHSGYSSTEGSSHSETLNTGFSRRRMSASFSYNQANSYALVTATGLTTVTVPVNLLGNYNIVRYNSRGIGGSVTWQPTRHLTLSGSATRSSGMSTSALLDSTALPSKNQSTVESGFMRYSLRKLYFTANVSHVQQGLVVAGNPIYSTTSYSIGVYRWLKLF